MIVYRDGEVRWMCDQCYDVAEPEAKGWRARKRKRGVVHHCPKHTTKGKK